MIEKWFTPTYGPLLWSNAGAYFGIIIIAGLITWIAWEVIAKK